MNKPLAVLARAWGGALGVLILWALILIPILCGLGILDYRDTILPSV